MPTIELVTDPGLEDLALDELRACVPGVDIAGELRPEGLAGHARATADVAWDEPVRRLRSIHRAIRPVDRLVLADPDPLGAIRAALTELAPAIPELAPEDAVFRVRCTRVGVHPFTSEDVEREAGAGVRAWATRGVRLKGPAVVVRCDVRDRDVLVGVELEGIRRPPPPYRPTTSLKPTLAWGLLALAGRPARELLDPFAGGGTVLLEAAATWPGARLHASDLHDRNVDGLRLNLPRAEVRSGDARRLDEVWADRRFDTVVTNPPFGRRLARDVDLEGLYRGFLRSAALVTTDDARVVVLAQKRGAFNRALRAVGAWETRHVRIVEVGGLYAGAFVLQRG